MSKERDWLARPGYTPSRREIAVMNRGDLDFLGFNVASFALTGLFLVPLFTMAVVSIVDQGGKGMVVIAAATAASISVYESACGGVYAWLARGRSLRQRLIAGGNFVVRPSSQEYRDFTLYNATALTDAGYTRSNLGMLDDAHTVALSLDTALGGDVAREVERLRWRLANVSRDMITLSCVSQANFTDADRAAYNESLNVMLNSHAQLNAEAVALTDTITEASNAEGNSTVTTARREMLALAARATELSAPDPYYNSRPMLDVYTHALTAENPAP